MNKTIFFLAKVFESKEYANDFTQGKLFSNRLSYFKNIEDDDKSNRGDRYEAVIGWHQPEKVQIQINGKIIPAVGPISTQMSWQDNLNVFCIYAAHNGGFTEISTDTLDAFRKQLEIPSDCSKLGEYAVIVLNVEQFLQRVKAAVIDKKYGLTTGLVEYYDPETFHGTFTETDSIFRKRNEFKHQKEYRFSIDTGYVGDEAIILDIGDISDITMHCKVSEINKYLSIKLPNKKSA